MSGSELSPLKQAVLALERMQNRLDAAEYARREPLAIVGMACRLPRGIDAPAAFWQALSTGVDQVTEVTPERWDIDAYYHPDADAPGKMATRCGGFLAGVDQFDPQFFGISPREAASMDPQQRLMLEVGWEALENAGQAPDQLRGSATGVFIGVLGSDYADMQLAGDGIERIDMYFGSGTARSMVSGRLSYVLGLQGPSVSIDTACSSSLVALHLACQSLRAGETTLAIVGGVNLTLAPEPTIALSRFHMLAPDGRCKTFDRRADGFVRAEACCALILKPLSLAVTARDRVLAVIRGSAVNQDGASSGLTAPNGIAQEAVIRSALKNAGIRPAEVTYVETHGTGTSLGDPVEVQALVRALGEGRPPESPIYLGAVKANLGHAEAAAGLVGVIKMVLCLQHQQLPRQLNFTEPNPWIPWDELPVRIPRETTRWPEGAPLVGGVSAFGFSGTNAHVLLEAAPAIPVGPCVASEPRVLTLSAAGSDALRETVRRYVERLEAEDAPQFADVCFTANVGRAHLRHRLSVIATSCGEAAGKLVSFMAGRDAADVTAAQLPTGEAPRLVYLFTGQGSQYAGMGRELYGRQAQFTAQLDRCDTLFRAHTGRSVLQSIYAGDGASLADTAFAQPAIFSIDCALAAMWQALGIEPDAVLGHSLGEFAAAHVAGVLTLEDAVKLVAARAQLMAALPSGGRMVAVLAPEATVRAAMTGSGPHVSIAALNGPRNVVISGTSEAVAQVLARLEGEEYRELAVSHAFHSALMEPMLDEFECIAGTVRYAPARQRLISNVTGAVARADVCTTPAYWRSHIRSPVQFAAGIGELQRLGFRAFLELGPHPVLSAMAARPGDGCRFIPTLHQGRDAWVQMLRAACALHGLGARVDWRALEGNPIPRKLELPTSVFQRKRYWLERRLPAEAQITKTTPILHPDWLYELTWSQRPLHAIASGERAPPRWILCTDTLASGRKLAGSVPGRMAACLVVSRDCDDVAQADQEFVLRDVGSEVVQEFLRSPQVAAFAPSVVIFAASSMPTGNASSTIGRDCVAAGGWLSALTRARCGAQFWLMTQGAQPAGGRAACNVGHAALAGWARVAMLEFPERSVGIVDCDPEDEGRQADSLLTTLMQAGQEDQVAWRAGQSFVARLKPKAVSSARGFRWRQDCSYLVTGWMGGLGQLLAQWLANRGVKQLVLVGRRAFSYDDPSMADAAKTVRALTARGVSLEFAHLDIDDPAGMRALVSRFGTELMPLAGVFHAAATSSHAEIETLDAAAYSSMLASKLGGAWLLHELTCALRLDCFVLFSSISAVLGTRKLAHYATANAALDAFAHWRHGSGLPTLSVNWGSWEQMRLVDEETRKLFQRSGFRPMASRDALAMLETALAMGGPQITIADVDWDVLKPVFEARHPRPLLSALATSTATATPDAVTADADGIWRFDDVAVERRFEVLSERVRTEVARALGAERAEEIESSRGLFEMGLDSLTAVELRTALGRRAGRKLPLTLTFNYPSVDRLTEFLAELLFAPDADEKARGDGADCGGGAGREKELERLLEAKLSEVQS